MTKTFGEELIARLNVARGRSGFLGVLVRVCLGSTVGGVVGRSPLGEDMMLLCSDKAEHSGEDSCKGY